MYKNVYGRGRDMQKAKRENILVTIVVAVVLVAICVALVDIYAQINEKQNQLDSLNRQINEQTQENLESQRLLAEEDEETYIEKYAREKLGFARPEERVFYSITG